MMHEAGFIGGSISPNDRVRLTTGESARILEIISSAAFLCEVGKSNDNELIEVSRSDIKSKIIECEIPLDGSAFCCSAHCLRSKPTKAEAGVLLAAQGDIINRGNTPIRCPRCGRSLEYRQNESGAAIYCIDPTCIILQTRGL
jgi:hypothetical protein